SGLGERAPAMTAAANIVPGGSGGGGNGGSTSAKRGSAGRLGSGEDGPADAGSAESCSPLTTRGRKSATGEAALPTGSGAILALIHAIPTWLRRQRRERVLGAAYRDGVELTQKQCRLTGAVDDNAACGMRG